MPRLAQVLVCAVVSFAMTAPPHAQPAQAVHRVGFEPAPDAVFEVLTQFYLHDAALPLDVRTLESWEQDGRSYRALAFTTGDTSRVPADLVLPASGSAPYPAVVLVHGLGSDRERWWREDRTALPHRLLDAGIAVLTLDLALHGQRAAANDFQSPVYLTFGNSLRVRSRDMGIQSTIDVRRALDLLRADPTVDAERLAIAGYSMGGMIGLTLGALEPALAAIVAAAVPTTDQPMPTDPFEFAPRNAVPTLLQIGRDDWLSSPPDAERLRDLLRSPESTLRFYDAGHSLPPAWTTDAADWLIARLKGIAS